MDSKNGVKSLWTSPQMLSANLPYLKYPLSSKERRPPVLETILLWTIQNNSPPRKKMTFGGSLFDAKQREKQINLAVNNIPEEIDHYLVSRFWKVRHRIVKTFTKIPKTYLGCPRIFKTFFTMFLWRPSLLLRVESGRFLSSWHRQLVRDANASRSPFWALFVTMVEPRLSNWYAPSLPLWANFNTSKSSACRPNSPMDSEVGNPCWKHWPKQISHHHQDFMWRRMIGDIHDTSVMATSSSSSSR